MNTDTSLAAPATIARAEPRPDAGYNVPIGRLRAGLTALVVAHHAVLAYHPYAPPPATSLGAPPQIWQAFPVVDPHKWTGWALLVGFNDIFFMALMFFVSGLFVWDSLERKGGGRFIRDRLVRLGVPFIAFAAVLAPLAYAPAYLQSASRGASGYLEQWLHLSNWPAGPAWFLWMLLAFGLAAAGIHAVWPGAAVWTGDAARRALNRPVVCWAGLAVASAAAFTPLAMRFTGEAWTAWGPFAFQTSRLLHYAVYFAAGAVVGASGIFRTFLAAEGALARRWPAWVAGALAAFVIASALYVLLVTHPAAGQGLAVATCVFFCVSCATSSFAALALFIRFSRFRSRPGDSFCAAAYGIYIVHYPIVSWIQYGLVGVPASGLVKGIVVTAASIGASWLLVSVLRRSRRIAAVI